MSWNPFQESDREENLLGNAPDPPKGGRDDGSKSESEGILMSLDSDVILDSEVILEDTMAYENAHLSHSDLEQENRDDVAYVVSDDESEFGEEQELDVVVDDEPELDVVVDDEEMEDDSTPESPGAEERVLAPNVDPLLAKQLDQIGRRVASEVGHSTDGSTVVGFFSVGRDEGVNSLASAFSVHVAASGQQVTFLRRARTEEEGLGFKARSSGPKEDVPRSRRVMTEENSFMVVEAASSSELLRCVLTAKDVCSERELVVVDVGSLEEEPDCDRLLRLTDAVIMVCRFGALSWERGERSVARLKECGVRVVGVVVTDAPPA